MIRKSDELLSIGEVSARTGVAVSAVRYYETLGLVPAVRTAGNMRKFPRHAIRRVTLIQLAVRFGIPLSEVGEVFASLPEGRTPNKKDWAKISTAWNQRLEDRKQAIARLQEELTGCIGCGCLSLQTCNLLNPGDELGLGGQGARRI
ncbi:redox-sensitive transcriptional activator SoxR [Rhodococcus sp. ACPA4]|jgi:MerR family redox-sensitive transcriptional activator SoxR|uniref:MerR family redox-sensitive transcriptional activator SoxR n=2 Tax=Nocardiaceae TaxID=85025 RepID=A0A652YR40_NOCGL|nr:MULTISPECIES: redox-sensitive transcriptional activator SoxR [Rhodococcus]NMD63396.1 redox-sensitive transcriptional activator SoxR [Nocardia globerula]KJF24453.1 Redox-sensitive transcriptional activator soxR [Rhodococcus sp. AD45]MCE4267861.1 redox-sensitive transcriptional activator SoxR [Rhodococcus globerulus]MDV6268844.1 redox-sensitive transcriptional activator SoxR [Rhodococcus globerulus]MDV8065188.1 redox-sensitive transcriptional activator SoxR [Rhodococcus sp. IEGM 1366]